MAVTDSFVEVLSGQQAQWFKQQSPTRQATLAAQWQGSGKTPEHIVEDNGGPAPQGGSDALPDIQ